MALVQPKKPAGGGYGCFLTEKRAEYTKLCAGKPISEVAKMAGAAWKNLSDAAKEPYTKAYKQNVATYEKEMAAFLAAGGEKTKGAAALRSEKRKAKEGGGKAKKAKKDENAPKRPAGGAFGCFLAANREAFQKECPGSVTGVTKLASERWKSASQADKDKFEKEYQAKKTAYEEAMKSYVPPAVEEDEVEEGEEDDEDDEEEGDDEEVKEKPKPAAKVAKKESGKSATEKAAAVKSGGRGRGGRASGRGRGAAKAAEPEVDIPKSVSDKAEKAGHLGVLKKLLARDDIKANGASPSAALAAIEKSGGLLHGARTALLGA